MPQLKSSDDFKPYGSTELDQRLTFRERLMNRFTAHDWVRVINIDDEPVYWQYMPQHAETFEYTPDPMKITRREPVEAWMLQPGSSEVIIGENAYVMIENLYKKLIAKGFLKKNGPNTAGVPGRNFNWSDANQQEKLINKIYLGKESPKFGNEKAHSQVPDTPRVAPTTARLRQAVR